MIAERRWALSVDGLSVEKLRHDLGFPAKLLVSNREPRPAAEFWTPAQMKSLYRYLRNDNDPLRYVMGFRNAEAKVVYARAKKRDAERAISWAVGSARGTSKLKLAFAPYSQNANGSSRWGALDFDAHEDTPEAALRARQLAFAAFHEALNLPDLFLILETSGSAGWHLLLVSADFRPVIEWVRLLRELASRISATLAPGVCEMFPPESGGDQYGRALRAPGGWNPRTDAPNLIQWENIHLLLRGDMIGEVTSPIRKNIVFSSSSSAAQDASALYRLWDEDWRTRFAIKESGTRNTRLRELVGECFHQVGRGMAERLARAQYDERAVATKGSLDDHLDEFARCWRGLERRFTASLSDPERQALKKLPTATENARDVFRIVRSFATKAATEGGSDFPLASGSLAGRLGLTFQGACYQRDVLTKAGVIRHTQAYTRLTSARYAWTIPYQ